MWTTDTELAPPRLTARAAPKRISLSGDEHLARLVRRRNEAAFAALYQRYHQRLYRYCRSMLHNDADAQDALQSTFTGAFSALAEGRRDAPMRPWLYRIAYNESISVMRRRRPEVALTEAHEASGASTEELVAERARLALLVADLRELTERQRGALVMRELSGLSHEEIATVFDISVGAAKQTIFEARRSLAEFAEGRAMACDEVCRAVSDGNGRVLRGRKLRAHLRECGSCAAFAFAIPARSSDLRAIAPPLSAVAAAGLLQRSLAASSGHGAGGAAATGSGAATASGGAGSGAASAGGVGSGAVGTSAVGSGSATVAAGAVSKMAGLVVAAKTAVGVAVVATAAAGVAGAVNHFDSSPSRGVASASALRQSGHSAGSTGHRSASAGAGSNAAATATSGAGSTSGRAAGGHRAKIHRAANTHSSGASANAGAQGHGKTGASGHGNAGASAGGTPAVHGKPPGATKTTGAASGGAGAKSPGAGHSHSGSNGHSSSSGHASSRGHSGSNGHSSSSRGHSSSDGGQSGQSSSMSSGKSLGPSTSTSSTTSSPSTTTAPAATHGLAGGSSSGGSASSSEPASGGSSAPGDSHSK